MITYGVLYDARVMSWPLLDYLMRGCVPSHVHYLIAEPLDGDTREWLSSNTDWSYTNGYRIVDALSIDGLDGLLVLRSHPEMYGPQIQQALHRGVPVTVLTVEEYQGGRRCEAPDHFLRTESRS